jgi:hypothetical protein
MFLSIDQTKEILNKAPQNLNKDKILRELVAKGYEIEGLDNQAARSNIVNEQIAQSTVGNQFEQTEPRNFLQKARDFAVGVIGGGKVAEGAGMAIAAPQVQGQLSEAQANNAQIETNLIKKIREKEQAGEDTSRLQTALQSIRATNLSLQDAQSDFVEALPSNKQVIGSAVRLATTLATPTVVKGFTGGNVAKGTLAGASQGAKIGAVEGAVQGAGIGAEQDLSTSGIIASAVGGGVTGGVLGGVVGGVSGRVKASSDLKAQKEALLKSNPNSTVAQYTLNGQGRIVNDPVAKEVIKQGFDQGTVATIKGASATDKAAMNKALDILEKAKVDKKYAALNRSSDVVGETAMKRYTAVNNLKNTAGKELDVVAKTLKGQKADPTPAVQSFIQDLSDLGVTFKNGKAVFKGSQIEGVKPAQSLINKAIKRMNEVGDDGFDLHNLKKYLDEQLNYGKTAEGLSGRTESIMKGLRANIDSILDNQFPAYNEVNTQYSTAKNALADFLDAAGSKFDVSKPGAEKQVGTLMRRILSNAQSRVQVTNAMQNLQDIAGTYGTKFDDDIISQLVFVDELERVFGSQAPTSMLGLIDKAKGATTMAGKMKSSEGIFDLALQLGGEQLEKVQGKNPDNLIKSLRDILR